MDRELEAFKSGFEYIVAHANPPEMFIIHRRNVQPDGRRDQVSAVYWILQDRIYPTPTLYDIMASRTVRPLCPDLAGLPLLHMSHGA